MKLIITGKELECRNQNDDCQVCAGRISKNEQSLRVTTILEGFDITRENKMVCTHCVDSEKLKEMTIN